MITFASIISRLRSRFAPPQSLGARGERLATSFLKRKGWKIVARNWEDTLGELDVVAVDQRTVVFVEVKTWSTETDDSPSAAVDQDKQQRLTRLALRFLKHHQLLECSARFDVIAIRWEPESRPIVEHITDAFQPVGRWQFFS